jgi:hypothetical protein
MDEYDGRQFVGIDLHRQRSVIVRQSNWGSCRRCASSTIRSRDCSSSRLIRPRGGARATYGWYWAVDVLHACGARVHLAHPLGSRDSATDG